MVRISGALALSLLTLAGCGFQRGAIRTPAGSVVGVKDAGTPATLSTGKEETTATIPAGTPITVTRIAAVPATEKGEFQPAREIVTFTPSAPLPVFQTKLQQDASTGKIDTSVAKRRIEVEANEKILWVALGTVALAIFLFYVGYPGPALWAGVGAGVFFALYFVANLPDWCKMVGVGAVVGAVCIWRAHERGLKVGASDPLQAKPVIPTA